MAVKAVIGKAVAVHGCTMMAAPRAAIDEQIAAAMPADMAHGYGRECLDLAGHPSQSSSASRFTAAALGSRLVIQCGDRPKL